MEVRLQKYISQCGLTSRRKAEELIQNGEVKVNGNVVTLLGSKIIPGEDVVEVHGEKIFEVTKNIYVLLHKPVGYVTTLEDPFERPTILDLLSTLKERVYPVGRLDYNTSGLLILTNDGELTYKLTHPKHLVNKVYIAKIEGNPTAKELDTLKNGVELEDFTTAPAKIKILKKDTRSTTIEITIHEGKNRQVRKMFSAIGHNIISLKRVATGKIFLNELPEGKFRYLSDVEVNYLKNL